MRSLRRKICINKTVWILLVLTPLTSWAQSPWIEISVEAEIAGVALDTRKSALYVSDRISESILLLDPISGEIRKKLAIAPSAAALTLSSDGSILACLIRLSGTIVLIDTRTFSVIDEIECGRGASVISSLPGNRFAVIDSFGDAVTIVDANTARIVDTLRSIVAIPNDAAATDGFLAITSRSPYRISFYDRAASRIAAHIDLTDAPVDIQAVPGGFVVLTRAELIIIAVDSRSIVQRTPVAGQQLLVDDDVISVLTPTALEIFDQELNPLRSLSLPTAGRIAVAQSGISIVVSRQSGKLLIHGGAAARVAATERRVTVEALDTEPDETRTSVEQPSPVRVPEATPPEETTVTEQEVQAVEQPPPPGERPSSAVEDIPASIAAADVEPLVPPGDKTPGPKSDRQPQYPQRFLNRPGKIRLGGFGAYAPRFSRSGGVTFEQAVADALNVVGDENSLMALDSTQPLLDIETSGELQRLGGVWTTDEPITFHIDEAHVASDSMKQDTDTGELLLGGNVKISKENATLTADLLHFHKRTLDTPEDPTPLILHNSDLELRHPLVPLEYEERRAGLPAGEGVMYGENIDLNEPGRELRADTLRYNLWQQTGYMENATGRAGPLYFSAQELRILGPADAEGQDIWLTTCDLPEPHYRIRMKGIEMVDGQAIVGRNARMQVGGVNTPLFLPRVSTALVDGERGLSTELDLGHRGELGYFVNVAQWFRATKNVQLAPRIYATSDEGVGFGFDGEYDYMDNPASPFFRSKGSYHVLQTTEGRGYAELYHRQELSESTVLLTQWEQWSDAEFVKDFYNDIYEDRTGPRTFANVTHTRPTLIASATVAPSTHSFTRETEKLPEGTLHFLERPLGAGFYGTFDSTAGYYRTSPDELEAARVMSMARLSYDWNLRRGLNVTPFAEVDGTWYSKTLDKDEAELRGTSTVGATVQGRVQRPYSGVGSFSGFKHIVVPSVTVSYRPDSSLNADDTPRFDDLDDRPGRTRVETILDNVLLGRNATSGESWRVARLTLYQGTDLENEIGKSEDYEVELEVRPRPWWGLQTVAEMHRVDTAPGDPGEDFNRVLSFLFFDNKTGKNNKNGRIGFAFTEADKTTINQEVFYGLGYKLTNSWSFGFQHRYDIERSKLERQSYEIRRRLHKWEMALQIRDKEAGVDVGFEISLIDFPGARFGL